MTYFEYMKRRQISYEKLIDCFTEWYLMCRDWKDGDKRHIEKDKARNLIVDAIEDAYLEEKLEGDGIFYAKDGSKIDYTHYTISIRSVANYLIGRILNKRFEAPRDFLSLLKGERAYTRMLREHEIDKSVCQAVAMTLWDIDPDMEIEQLSEHQAIQKHGKGKLYTDPKTVRGWLSEVDVRRRKRGRKKQ